MGCRFLTALALGTVLSVIWTGPNVVALPPGEHKVQNVQILGVQNVPLETIRNEITIRKGEILIPEKAEINLRAIEALGYFQEVAVDYKKVRDGVEVIFTVKENPLVTSVSLNGNRDIPETELANLLVTRANQTLSFTGVRKDIDTIQGMYRDRGFLLARVVDVSNDLDSGEVTFTIVEGTIEQISVDGNDLTKENVILREMKSAVGRALNQKTLSKDIQRIFNLGFFEEVSPSFEPGREQGNILLILHVKERRTNSINFGGGFGEREGVFGFIDLSVDNLFGTGQSLLIRGQSGANTTSYQFRFNNPWLFPHLFGERTGFTFRRWFTEGSEIYLATEQLQDQRQNGYEVEFRKSLTDNTTYSFNFGNNEVVPIRTASFESFNSLTVGVGFTYDTRDFFLNPTQGRLISMSVRRGIVTPSTTAITEFMRYTLDGTEFVRLTPPHVIALHGGLGYGTGVVPINELFFVGGANTVRGYNPTQAVNGVIKVLGNIEYRYTFNDVVQGVIFYDFGSASNSRPTLSGLLTGRGFGFRLTTPLGPIRLDYGMPSGASFGEGVTHFSIGQAF